jgi:hypothetical protein
VRGAVRKEEGEAKGRGRDGRKREVSRRKRVMREEEGGGGSWAATACRREGAVSVRDIIFV